MLDMGFHVFDLLIQRVVLVKQSAEVGVIGLELGNQFSVFGEHQNTPCKGKRSGSRA
jgi:hypothetical protein